MNSAGWGLLLVIGALPFAASAQATPIGRGAARPDVVLADFNNATADPQLGRALTQALVLEVSQSPFLSLLSERKVTDALQAMGRSATGRITASVGRQLCLRTVSQDVIDGVIALHDGHYEIDLRAVACGSGATVAEERAQAAAKKDILRALHTASLQLRSAMGEAPASVRRFSMPAGAATSSLEALDDYSLGLTTRRDSGDVPSIPLFERALARDPTFPLADAVLAGIYGNLHQPFLAVRCATRAYVSRNRVGERERFHIAGVYFLATGQLPREMRNYESWQAVYPDDFTPYNNLGNDYAAIGELQKSLGEYRTALQIAPSVIAYTNVSGMQLALNRFAAGGATLDEASARGIDGRYLHQIRYWLAFAQGDATQMERQLAWARGRPGDEDPLLSMQSDTEAYSGRLRQARELSRQAVKSALGAGSKETAALWQVNDALRDAEVGDAARARRGVASALTLSRGRDVEVMAAFALARAGYATQAAALVQTVQKEYRSDSLLQLYWLPTIRAAIELDGRDGTAALAELKTVLPYELGGAGTFINYVYPAYVRGEVYLEAGNGGAAAAEFRKLLAHRGIVLNFVTGSLAYLQLGRAYAMAGDTAKARLAYREFLTLWKNADPDVPALLQAQAQYKKVPEAQMPPAVMTERGRP